MQNDTKPLLSVRNLRTSFFQDEGTTKAVDGASFDVFPGKTLGIVGESGCGKSVTAQSILRIVDRPGRIVEGEIVLTRADGSQIDLVKLKANGREIRSIRGGDIGLIFQEPMTSFSPVHTVGAQIIEAVLLHNAVGKKEARRRGIEALRSVGHPEAGAAHRRVLVRIERRAPPARDDRGRAFLRSAPPDRRRAHDGPGRHHAGADPGSAAQDPAGTGNGHHAHHPQPRRGRGDGRRRGRHVSGPRGRARQGRRHLSRSEASVYEGAAAVDTEHRVHAEGEASDHQRVDSAPVQPADGLPLPSPLRFLHAGPLRHRGTAPCGGRRRAERRAVFSTNDEKRRE